MEKMYHLLITSVERSSERDSAFRFYIYEKNNIQLKKHIYIIMLSNFTHDANILRNSYSDGKLDAVERSTNSLSACNKRIR